MPTIVLVHGAWLDASCWDEVASSLRASGCRVVTPDLPGHGGDDTPLSQCTLEAYVERIIREVDAASDGVVLVGHSMGGIVISSVAERRPDAVRRLVYVAAYLLGDGESIQRQQDADSRVPSAMRPAADWSTVALDPVLMTEIFFHDVPDVRARSLVSSARAEPTAPFGTPLQLSAANFGRVSRAYVMTANDRAVSPSLQQRFLDARPCDAVVTLSSGHAPFASQPERLADVLRTMVSATNDPVSNA